MFCFENCTFNYAQKSDSERIKKNDYVKILTPKRLAELHYKCLHNLITEHSAEKEKTNSSDNLISTISCISSYLIKELPDMRNDIVETEYKVKNRITQLGDELSKGQSKYYLSIYDKSFFKTEFDKCELPYGLIKDLIDMHTAIWESQKAKDEFNSRWETIRSKDYGNRGTFAIECMNEILVAGEIFWNQNGFTPKVAGNYPPEGMTCSEWVKVCDAIGSIMGSVFGIVGSAIVGTMFSIGAERDCEDRPA